MRVQAELALRGRNSCETVTGELWGKAGTRKSSPDSMADIAKWLSAGDVAAVAAYYQSLREAVSEAAK